MEKQIEKEIYAQLKDSIDPDLPKEAKQFMRAEFKKTAREMAQSMPTPQESTNEIELSGEEDNYNDFGE
jgi:hypothetical protein